MTATIIRDIRRLSPPTSLVKWVYDDGGRSASGRLAVPVGDGKPAADATVSALAILGHHAGLDWADGTLDGTYDEAWLRVDDAIQTEHARRRRLKASGRKGPRERIHPRKGPDGGCPSALRKLVYAAAGLRRVPTHTVAVRGGYSQPTISEAAHVWTPCIAAKGWWAYAVIDWEMRAVEDALYWEQDGETGERRVSEIWVPDHNQHEEVGNE